MADNNESKKDQIFESKQETSDTSTGIKVWIRHGNMRLGPGGYRLFTHIDACGSVKKACAEIGISYSKGWSIIRAAEDELNFKIVDRQQGGAGGGAASITERGRKLLKAYEVYTNRVNAAINDIFKEVFENEDIF